MGFYDLIPRRTDDEWDALFGAPDGAPGARAHEAARRAISSESPSVDDLAALVSRASGGLLEEMASRAAAITLRHFGRTIQLYAPLYLSDHCDNECVYCGFSSGNAAERKRLTASELEREAQFLSSEGMRHVLILTGESRSMSPVSYIRDCVGILHRYFSSISIEVYPLTQDEYRSLAGDGVDGLTIYQETYDEARYKKLHGSGPKSDYAFRLGAPERAAAAGMRSVNIGPLFGLGDWRREAFLAALHAKYLQDAFPGVEMGVAVPRMRPHAGPYRPEFDVTDRDLVQAICALRIFLPRFSITVSTREEAVLRDNLIGLGITRMSAGSSTRVGGYAAHTRDTPRTGAAGQFEISDERSVAEVAGMLQSKGYQPVFKDWMRI
jgi:2-iminoacetate synthase